jgi:hypothetical protein
MGLTVEVKCGMMFWDEEPLDKGRGYHIKSVDSVCPLGENDG